MKFSFPLDPFQIRAIYRLERNEIPFVSAPTSSGKTLVGQYAISLALSKRMKAIYTSPIKSLSNQKFRDFSREYDKVGIVTGDVVLNRDASILIMTTEILRSMVYHNDDLLHDVDAVIFDECHFLGDDERGVVWEEIIILLPEHINMVFLSATVPNDKEIATWIAKTKMRKVYVERHEKRPVPLVQSIYYEGKIFKLQEPERPFNRGLFKTIKTKEQQLLQRLKPDERKKKRDMAQTPTFWHDLSSVLQKEKLLPTIVFAFAQKRCEVLAVFVKSQNFLTETQSRYVNQFFDQSISCLKPKNRQLAQVIFLKELLLCGIGVHHAGLIPILKEIVEILLSEGYVQILFSTSTVQLGLNVPVRSCVFSKLEKFNGKETVPLTPTEYIQMSGRAGRRGKDVEGISIVVSGLKLPPEEYLIKVQGKAEHLESNFQLRPPMVLQMLRSQDLDILSFTRSSLYAHQLQSTSPRILSELTSFREQFKTLSPIQCPNPDIEDIPIQDFQADLVKFKKSFEQIIFRVQKFHYLKTLKPGMTILHLQPYVGYGMIFDVDPIKEMIQVRSSSKTKFTIQTTQIGCLFTKTLSSQELHNEDLVEFTLNGEIPPVRSLKFIDPHLNVNFKSIQTRQTNFLNKLIKSPCFKCPNQQRHIADF